MKDFCMELAAVNGTKFQLDGDIWTALPCVVQVLAVFAAKTKELQKEDLTLPDSYGIWLSLVVRLKNLSHIPLSSKLLQHVEKRLKDLMEDDVLVAALYLDPRYQLVLSETQKSNAVQHLTNLHRKLTENIDTNDTDFITIDAIDDPDIDEVDKYLSEVEMQVKGAVSLNVGSVSSGIHNELNSFAKIDRRLRSAKIVPFWNSIRHEYPNLYEVAKTVLAIPPTEVSVERNFSHLDFILNKRRNNLTDEALETILLLRLNRNLFSEASKTFFNEK